MDIVCIDDDGKELMSGNDNFGKAISMTLVTPYQRWQPIRTWDWELPMLATLQLDSEFAYTFQFRMLVGTPNFVSLSVDIGSRSSDLHKRIIRVADLLLKPGSRTRPPLLPLPLTDENEGVEYIHAPALKHPHSSDPGPLTVKPWRYYAPV
ncbi:hypothetical protein BG015_008284 [Linnemannia schmuckeri]|uniref:Uncharacterized protein n=1 Tax=Linnemannia schmuckeri TaxID=64567 RepID=A0A9P5RX52_9FUNG|nr:hypothetical protein BG015_008284 [Linnemannia schmuckeri]